MSQDESQAVAELQAAAAIVRKHRPAAMVFRLTCDRAGVVRLVLERMEGIPLAALACEDLDRERTIVGT